MKRKDLDLKKFKKVSSDKRSSVFRHDDGHELRVAHSSLTPALRKQLENIKMHQDEEHNYAHGGGVSLFDKKKDLSKFAQEDADAAANADFKPYSIPNDMESSPGMSPVDSLAPAAAAPAATLAPAMDQQPAAAPAQVPQSLQQFEDLAKAQKGAIGEQIAGVNMAAKAQGELGQAQAKLREGQQNELLSAAQTFEAHKNEIIAKRQALQNDIMDDHVNPNRYIQSMSTGSKIASGIGLILGGMGAGLTGGPNLAFQYLQGQIDKDLDAQKSDIGKKQSLMSILFEESKDLKEAYALARIKTNDIVASRIQQEADKSQNPLAKAAALVQIGKLHEESAKNQNALAVMKMTASAGQSNDPWLKQINALSAVNPKAAEELRQRYVPGQGIANTNDDAKAAKEVMIRHANIQRNVKQVVNMVKKGGTYDLLGSHNQELDMLAEQIATDMAKMQDPNSVARPTEVESVKKNLASPGIFKRDATAIAAMNSFEKSVNERANTAMAKFGLGQVSNAQSEAPEPQRGKDGKMYIRKGNFMVPVGE